MAVSSNDSCVLYIRKRGINWLIAGRGSFFIYYYANRLPQKSSGLRTTPPIYYISQFCGLSGVGWVVLLFVIMAGGCSHLGAPVG